MKEFGDGRDRDQRGDAERDGDHEKGFSSRQTGHFCIGRQTEVQSSVGDGDI